MIAVKAELLFYEFAPAVQKMLDTVEWEGPEARSSGEDGGPSSPRLRYPQRGSLP